MGRKIPPFSAVRAFEAAAHHKSFRAAADALCLSPSAISHQVRALEDYLDTALFEREGNRLTLTLTGRSYANKLTVLLDGFDEATRAVVGAGSRTFRVLSTPGFAARWLVPRLDRLAFGDRVRIRVSTGAPSTDFTTNDADLVIQWAQDTTPGVCTEPLMQSGRFPVIHPDLRARARVETPADLLRLPLIYDETDDSWNDWFRQAGLAGAALPSGPVFANCELATTAVERGLGVSLAYESVVRDTLAEGRIVRLFDQVTFPRVIYSVAYPDARAQDPMIRQFRDWIFAEVASDGPDDRRAVGA